MVTAMPSSSTPREKSKLNVASHDANNGRYYFLLELAMSYVARHCSFFLKRISKWSTRRLRN